MTASRRLFTIGHSTRSIEEFAAMLHEAAVTRIVDVRYFPGARRHPQFGRETLPPALASRGIDYQHLRELGGRRGPQHDRPSRNTLWRVEAFRNYADYAETSEFREALDRLERLAEERPTAIMCAEAVWWRCHRRIVADYLLTSGMSVFHLMGDDKVSPATLTVGAVPAIDGLHYPAVPA